MKRYEGSPIFGLGLTEKTKSFMSKNSMNELSLFFRKVLLFENESVKKFHEAAFDFER